MFNDILVPLDGSELSERALPVAQNLARSSEATVHLVHMVSREHELGAGRGDGSVIVDRVKSAQSDTLGYDASEEISGDVPEMVDMIKKGIIDPVKVTRTALQNAASAAAIFLTTEVAISEEPEEKKEGAMPEMPGGMPMGM